MSVPDFQKQRVDIVELTMEFSQILAYLQVSQSFTKLQQTENSEIVRLPMYAGLFNYTSKHIEKVIEFFEILGDFGNPGVWHSLGR